MNKDILNKASLLREQIEKEEIVKEYLRVKKIFEDNEELKKIREEIARLYSQNKIKEHKALKEQYENIPLVQNYYSLKEEVISLFNQIKEILDV